MYLNYIIGFLEIEKDAILERELSKKKKNSKEESEQSKKSKNLMYQIHFLIEL